MAVIPQIIRTAAVGVKRRVSSPQFSNITCMISTVPFALGTQLVTAARN